MAKRSPFWSGFEIARSRRLQQLEAEWRPEGSMQSKVVAYAAKLMCQEIVDEVLTSEEGSYLRRIDLCHTQLQARG